MRKFSICFLVLALLCCSPAFSLGQSVADADSTSNLLWFEVVGNKADSAQTSAGTTYSIVSYLKGLISLVGTVDTVVDGLATNDAVATADATTNAYVSDVVGNKTDASVEAVTTTKSLMAYLKGVLNQLSGTSGITTWAAGAAPGNGVSISEGLRYTSENVDKLLVPVEATGTTDIDISEADYTGYVLLLTITPAAGYDLTECVIDLDWNKTTTGVNDVATNADTLDFCVASKIDGTNFRGISSGTQVTLTGDPATLGLNAQGARFDLGPVGENAEVAVYVKLNAERADAEIPYTVTYISGAAPTITEVAAG